MGAWSYEPFGNDDAADWIYDIEESKDFLVIENALSAVTEKTNEYLEAPQCSLALAAAEIVAALLGKPVQSLPGEVATWVRGKPKPNPALVTKAKSAVVAVLQSSELQELWMESENYSQWQNAARDLLARLG